MRNGFRWLGFFPLFFLLWSCSGGGGADSSSSEEQQVIALNPESGVGQKALEDKYANFGKTFEQDDEGNWKVSSNARRSQFEGRQMTTIGGGVGGKDFRTNRYDKKSWGQSDKNFAKQRYGGDTDSRYDNAEWFLQQQAAGEAAQRSRLQGESYGTSQYATSSAREARTSGIARRSDVETDVRRDVYSPPVKMSPSEAGMSVDETKNKVGRLLPWADDD
ncbi:MAG: hypothetical protein Q7Q71_03730 [Verrucomicrobiota bacterium JB023]|nr:hypothetical protein [Verrucomicrobiota bacterium JB023]